ncbi:MAG: tetratricopeptide repeat protein [Gemmatimonas sp.]
MLLTGAGSLAIGALPCRAQTFATTSANANANVGAVQPDSVYQARMNEGYAAVKAGDQAAAAAAFDAAAARAPRDATARVAAGYAFLALGRNDDALARFDAALAIDENQDAVRRQTGYIHNSAGRRREALASFTWLRSRDRASAQDLQAIGNLNVMLRDPLAALDAFNAASTLAAQMGDSVVLRDARRAIDVIESAAAQSSPHAFVDVYLAPFYQSRFENSIGFGIARAGVSAGGSWRPTVYASVRLTRDSKSVGGLQPLIYSDNSVVPALGVRVRPGGKWFTVFAEAGAAYPLVSSAPKHWKRDLRAGVIGAVSNTRPLTIGAWRPSLVSDLFGDITWYDRFDRNTIGYAQLRESLRLVEGRAGAVDVFARGWITFDSKSTYFNRIVEGGGGVALHAGANRRASLYVESLAGRYLKDRTVLQPSRNYSDFRVMLVTGFFHAKPFSAR